MRESFPSVVRHLLNRNSTALGSMSGARGAGSSVEIVHAQRAGYHLTSSLPFLSQILSHSLRFSDLASLTPFRILVLFLLQFVCDRRKDAHERAPSLVFSASKQPTITRDETLSSTKFSSFIFIFISFFWHLCAGGRRVHFSDVESPRGHDDEMISFGFRDRRARRSRKHARTSRLGVHTFGGAKPLRGF